METLVLDGKRFVKAATAAKALGYTSDYVGQLCRSEKIEAHLVGRSWYVDQEALREHRIDKKRSSSVKAREQVQKAVKEGQEAVIQHIKVLNVDNKAFEKRVKYEEDTEDLIPMTKKLEVVANPSKKKANKIKVVEKDTGPNYTVVNEGQKIVMSGKLDIVDVTDEDVTDEDVVIMHAKIVKNPKSKKSAVRAIKKADKRHIQKTKVISVKEIEEETSIKVHESTVLKKSPFLKKLGMNEEVVTAGASSAKATIQTNENTIDVTDVTEKHIKTNDKTGSVTAQRSNDRTHSLLPYVVILCLIIFAAMTMLETTWSVSGVIDTNSTVDTTYSVDYTDLLELLR